jgi:transcriptional regulator with XRE-family HTH domain
MHVPTASAAQKRKLSPDSEIDLRQSAERIDTHVGMRFRLRRQELGMSQTAVADELGVTFQQVQKYERGMNRISASRLHDLCGILSIPVEYFFDGLEDDIDEPEGPDLSDPELMELVDAYMGIPRQMTRARLSAMLRSVARWVEE